ncbi:MAG: hypothetical protein HC857_14490 [Synechococcales cyanobacterium RU_4_20]|nr:hypothetical protein [Synechococcales cyanobacterium RU_4_20]
MFYFLICWSSLIVICTVIGGGVLDLIQRSAIRRLGDRWMIAIWLGILALALCLLSASFFLPLTPWVGITLMALLVGLAWRRPGARQLLGAVRARATGRKTLLVFLLMLVISVPTTQPVIWYDTGLYHSASSVGSPTMVQSPAYRCWSANLVFLQPGLPSPHPSTQRN